MAHENLGPSPGHEVYQERAAYCKSKSDKLGQARTPSAGGPPQLVRCWWQPPSKSPSFGVAKRGSHRGCVNFFIFFPLFVNKHFSSQFSWIWNPWHISYSQSSSSKGVLSMEVTGARTSHPRPRKMGRDTSISLVCAGVEQVWKLARAPFFGHSTSPATRRRAKPCRRWPSSCWSLLRKRWVKQM